MGDEDALRRAARAWLETDPDPDTRAELEMLLDLDDVAGLADRFGATLRFGTAGIRGTLGAGPNRMNRAVVRRVTAGVAERLLASVDGARDTGVVVGRDARYKSEEFAEDTARVLAGAGLAVHRIEEPVPTPLVAFAVRHLGAAAGIVITASHNPPSDNGYKVYWDDGVQIVPPIDDEISTAIDAFDDLFEVPLADVNDQRIAVLGDEVREAYLQAAAAVPLGESRSLRIVYTPLHGVAGDLALGLLARAGFDDVHVVAEQAQPDPDFPTVAFPNPEEPGALDLALDLAAEVGADLLLANDPDGDRLAVAVPDLAGWRVLTGDEVGCLLADHRLGRLAGDRQAVVGTTVVSSQLLARIAEAHGAAYAETLTGFKWLARVAADAEATGRRFVLAYEQALGYMVGDAVRDKDGLTAALAFADLAATLKSEGRMVGDALDDLARRFGVHATIGRAVRLEGPDSAGLVTTALERLRDTPPPDVEGVAVISVADHMVGARRRLDTAVAPARAERLDSPPAELVALTLADGSRLQVRPSGTEPLLKFYVEAVEPVAQGDVASARARVGERLDRLADTFVSLAVG
jgi:phosphomannomutase